MKVYHRVFVLLFLSLLGSAFAQREPRLIITPPEVSLEPGQGQRFEAALFDANGQPLRIAGIQWRIEPDSLGKITEDGFFMAGRLPGEVRVIAEAKAEGHNAVFVARALVRIGRPEPPRLRVVIRPESAVVPPGEQQKFAAFVLRANGDPVPVTRTRWEVHPRNLGEITDDGVFTAGREFVHGEVVAFVATPEGAFHGAARVTVAARPTSAISGNVKADDGTTPLYGVVWAERVAGSPWRGQAQIGENGDYLIDNLIPGLYVVRAQARGFLPEYYNNTDQYVEATPVQVAAQDTVGGIDFSLTRGGSISGKITADADGLPLAGAHVFASRVVRPDFRHHAVTVEDGSYTIENLPTATFAVFAEAAGYKGEFYDDAQNLLEAKLVSVNAPENVAGIDMSLATASAIAGRVVDAISGEPVARALISIHGNVGPRPELGLRHTFTNENGEYIAGVPPGVYLVSAEARGYNQEYFDGVANRREATEVKVEEGAHTGGINFQLDPFSSISGKVTDQLSGAPIAEALILAFPERSSNDPAPPRTPHVAKTDENGLYRLEGLRSGKYFVMAESRGYLNEFWQEASNLREATPVEVAASGEVANIDFTLEKGGSLSGAVVSAADGSPIGGALVHVWQSNGDAVGRAETGRDGAYRVAGLRPGDYLVHVEAKGFKPVFYDGVESRADATPVHIEASNETSGIDFKLQQLDNRRGAISGTVVSEIDGNPIPSAIVLALPLERGPAGLALTDELGEFVVRGLRPGKYVLMAHARHFISEFYDNVRHYREATPVVVESNQETAGIHFDLAPAQRGPYTLAGRVLRGNSNMGEANAVIYALENGSFVASAISDENGNFAILDLPAGEYKVMGTGQGGSAYFGGRDEHSAANVVLNNAASVSNVTINLPDAPTDVEQTAELPTTFALLQNFPNPFNPETVIQYQLPERVAVSLKIFNALGQEVITLVQETQEAGVYKVKWEGRDKRGVALSTGIYLFQLKAGEFSMTRKMAYVR